MYNDLKTAIWKEVTNSNTDDFVSLNFFSYASKFECVSSSDDVKPYLPHDYDAVQTTGKRGITRRLYLFQLVKRERSSKICYKKLWLFFSSFAVVSRLKKEAKKSKAKIWSGYNLMSWLTKKCWISMRMMKGKKITHCLRTHTYTRISCTRTIYADIFVWREISSASKRIIVSIRGEEWELKLFRRRCTIIHKYFKYIHSNETISKRQFHHRYSGFISFYFFFCCCWEKKCDIASHPLEYHVGGTSTVRLGSYYYYYYYFYFCHGGNSSSNSTTATKLNGLSSEPLKWEPKEKDVVFVLGLFCLHQI